MPTHIPKCLRVSNRSVLAQVVEEEFAAEEGKEKQREGNLCSQKREERRE